jgi:hypothetical protein
MGFQKATGRMIEGRDRGNGGNARANGSARNWDRGSSNTEYM